MRVRLDPYGSSRTGRPVNEHVRSCRQVRFNGVFFPDQRLEEELEEQAFLTLHHFSPVDITGVSCQSNAEVP